MNDYKVASTDSLKALMKNNNISPKAVVATLIEIVEKKALTNNQYTLLLDTWVTAAKTKSMIHDSIADRSETYGWLRPFDEDGNPIPEIDVVPCLLRGVYVSYRLPHTEDEALHSNSLSAMDDAGGVDCGSAIDIKPTLLQACKAVVDNWESGDLAAAARMCQQAYDEATNTNETTQIKEAPSTSSTTN